MENAISVTPEEYEAAGGDPMKIPRIAEALGKVEEKAGKEFDEMMEKSADVDLSDLASEFVICGRPVRPLSAGVMSVLQKAGHPLFAETDKEPDLLDVAALLLVLSHPSVPELIQWAHEGTLYLHAEEFSFSLTPKEIAQAEKSAQVWIDEAAREMAISGYSDGEESTKKNEQTG